MSLTNYTLGEKLFESMTTTLYRGRRNHDGTPVVIKLLRSEHPTFRELARFRYEYSLLRDLKVPGVVKAYALESHKKGLALVLEDQNGMPLSELCGSKPMDPKAVVRIGLRLAEILGALHEQRIVHKDIKPHNIIADRGLRDVCLIDFGMATRLSQETQRVMAPGALEGTLAYMSPEQTGRMNRAVDKRTDFYSLGVTLYEMLAGGLPFPAASPMDMVHSHIARTPTPPHERVSGVPHALSAIILKLLAKAAEERYQGAFGLAADLRECLSRLERKEAHETFTLGMNDRAQELRISHKLYGRDRELAELLSAFERVGRGAAELLLIAGYSGIGKSVLVHEIHSTIARRGGYFISGKFDQLHRNVPYVSVAQAFRELLRQVLTEREESLSQWKERLQAAVGGAGGVLADLIPEVSLLLGPQPEAVPLGPTEAQNRFNLVFMNFLDACATSEHPLLLFLDDLQWADPGSLKLLQLMLTDPQRNHLLVVGAYRNNEVDAAHPLALLLSELRKGGSAMNEVKLPPLSLPDITALLCDSLACSPDTAEPLAQVVLAKTGGNPFFMNQFLAALDKDKLLRFDVTFGRWDFCIDDVERYPVTANVVEFMAGKIQSLSPVTVRILELAACIGHQFDLHTLSLISEEPVAKVGADLWEALEQGFVVPVDGDYRFVSAPRDGRGDSQDGAAGAAGAAPGAAGGVDEIRVTYRFLHDRVQQAAYSLIDEGRRQEVHLRIGRLLWAGSRDGGVSDVLFDIVNHMNLGSALITDPEERAALARKDLEAGRKAKAATAYETAAAYLAKGMALLDPQSWETAYELTFCLYAERAECEFLSGRFEEAEPLFDLLLSRARSNVEKAQIHTLHVVLFFTRGLPRESVRIGRLALALFGIELPETDDGLQKALFAELEAVSANLTTRSIPEIYNAPPMTDPEVEAVVKLLTAMAAPAYVQHATLFALVPTKMTHLSLVHGNSNLSPFGYMTYGIILGAILGEYDKAYQMGRMALDLNEKFQGVGLVSKLCLVFGAFINFLKNPLRPNLAYLERGIAAGLETGDFAYASYCCNNLVLHRVALGDELSSVREDCDKFLALMVRTKEKPMVSMLTLSRQVTVNLTGRTHTRHGLNDDTFDEKDFIGVADSVSDHLSGCWYYTAKLELLYLYGDHEGALAMAMEAEKRAGGATAMYFLIDLAFYQCLTLCALCRSAPDTVREEHLAAAAPLAAKLASLAESCPENFRHKHLLVSAELAALTGDEARALTLYEQAVECAEASDFARDEALALELCAMFHVSRGRNKLAGYYLDNAYQGYVRWGALAKAKDLVEKDDKKLLSTAITAQAGPLKPSSLIATESAPAVNSKLLDIGTVLDAAQAISSEIVLDRLLDTLMRIAMENAGAQRGFLILDKGGRLFIEAERAVDPKVTVRLPVPVEDHDLLSPGIVHYVARTKQNVVLNDAAVEGMFTVDAYVARHKPRSVLCAPLVNQGKLVAIVYLENNLTDGAFTADRLEVLWLLSAQAALSIQNAVLYSKLEDYSRTLEQKVDDRTRELKTTNEELRQTLNRLRIMQKQLVVQEKLASLGALTAGIAHEIQNPLNFVNNFAELSIGLAEELSATVDSQRSRIEPDRLEEIDGTIEILRDNARRIHDHGRRASQIIDSMLVHAPEATGIHELADLNAVLIESIHLVQHTMRTKAMDLEVSTQLQLDPTIGRVHIVSSDIRRVFINVLQNACYALKQKQHRLGAEFRPELNVLTHDRGDRVEVRIRDNGTGIPSTVLDKVFHPFFTTKPPGEGTGLGLSISHEIITGGHQGEMRIESVEGELTELIIDLPKSTPASV